VLADPQIRQRLADMGGQATPSSPEGFRNRVETDIARFNRIVTTARIERE
jgi:tripartite-type tricarboxylate transporter receptor subunit TctC